MGLNISFDVDSGEAFDEGGMRMEEEADSEVDVEALTGLESSSSEKFSIGE